ncbi:MAG: type II toxin-antitoxin system RelE family toxin [Candidatus Methylomirabilis sp.]
MDSDELRVVQSVLKRFEANQIEFDHADASAHRLLQLWDMGILRRAGAVPEEDAGEEEQGRRDERVVHYYDRVKEPAAPFHYLRKAEWLLGMSDEFLKAVTGIDRKLQGRVLEAIGDISVNPIEPKGDTVKPLTGEMKGLWRYRIGDYRLVYWPDANNRRVVLVDFSSRASAYP